LRLRCFVVFELKIEDFKPEFAGKMNFYLSAVDDQLRHSDDQPSIGIILCKGRRAVIVEYALRDTSKPMGVAQYRLSPTLPDRLKRDLPTAEDFAREFSAMSLLKLRVEIERALRNFVIADGNTSSRPTSIGAVLQDLKRRGIAPRSTDRFLDALRVMNEAAHGFDVDPVAADKAIRVGTEFLTELSK
jgi:hypothetical protein